MLWFTSDQHFGHTNILKYEEKNRPFKTTDEMDAELIKRWNDVVGKDDIVYHLGDVAFKCNTTKLRSIVEQLHGYKILIKGNHDFSTKKMFEAGFAEVYKEFIMYDDHVPILYLKHNPEKVINPPCKNIVSGHVHGLWKTLERDGLKFINVGVDVRDLFPVSLTELEKELI